MSFPDSDAVTVRDRFHGALIGLATGDALGTTVEFSPPGTFAPLADMEGGGPFDLMPGEWTDDTSMALCLADSLVERRGFDPVDQLERYVRWYREGYLSSNGRCFDIGITVRGALERFGHTGNPWSGSSDPQTAGNGSLMRLAPVPLFFSADAAEAIERSGDSSRTTHGAPEAVDACRYFGGLLVGAAHGAGKDELLGAMYSPVPGYWDAHPLSPAIAEVAGGSFKAKSPPQIVGSGYVVKSLEAALWAFFTTDSFRDGCLRAANLGNDADTTAAIYGQLAGAFYGVEAIPPEWRDLLARRGLIERLADGLYDLSRGRSAAM
ncbi:MAG TPA: ADP-ribosylglycohydrolase family protein [Longimicrobium sp.]|nr:ADP-ribosylglycohydrolase family protein [Longimicrobium sp.]